MDKWGGQRFNQFSEVCVLKNKYALGDEAESAFQTVADPGQYLGSGYFRFGLNWNLGLRRGHKAILQARPPAEHEFMPAGVVYRALIDIVEGEPNL